MQSQMMTAAEAVTIGTEAAAETEIIGIEAAAGIEIIIIEAAVETEIIGIEAAAETDECHGPTSRSSAIDVAPKGIFSDNVMHRQRL